MLVGTQCRASAKAESRQGFVTEVGCTSAFGVGERDFGAGKGCREWEVMGEEGKD